MVTKEKDDWQWHTDNVWIMAQVCRDVALGLLFGWHMKEFPTIGLITQQDTIGICLPEN